MLDHSGLSNPATQDMNLQTVDNFLLDRIAEVGQPANLSEQEFQSFENDIREELEDVLVQGDTTDNLSETLHSEKSSDAPDGDTQDIFQAIDLIIDRLAELLAALGQGSLQDAGITSSTMPSDSLFNASPVTNGNAVTNYGNQVGGNGSADFKIPPSSSSIDGAEELNLTKNSDGTLTEDSKQQVAEYAAGISAQNGGREVAVTVTEDLQVQATVGEAMSVAFEVPDSTIFSLHTHPAGSSPEPSSTDRANQIAGAEDAVAALDSDFNVIGITQYA